MATEAAAIAGDVRNWSTLLYGTGADIDEYKTMVRVLLDEGLADDMPDGVEIVTVYDRAPLIERAPRDSVSVIKVQAPYCRSCRATSPLLDRVEAVTGTATATVVDDDHLHHQRRRRRRKARHRDVGPDCADRRRARCGPR